MARLEVLADACPGFCIHESIAVHVGKLATLSTRTTTAPRLHQLDTFTF